MYRVSYKVYCIYCRYCNCVRIDIGKIPECKCFFEKQKQTEVSTLHIAIAQFICHIISKIFAVNNAVILQRPFNNTIVTFLSLITWY